MAGTWTKLTKQPGASVDTMLLLTDGTVVAHEENSANWHRLTPDAGGNYGKGTWSTLPPMPPNDDVPAGVGGPTYGPKFFGSAVLADGTMLVVGGEYNQGNDAELAAGARYDPVNDGWTNVTTPSGWNRVGDPPLCVLPDGRPMMGHLDSRATAFFDPDLGTFSLGPDKGDRCAEESFTLLQDGTVLAVDCSAMPKAEKYLPWSGRWVSAGDTPTTLPQSCAGIVAEIGPTVVLPDGRAFVIGATGDTALYSPPADPADAGTWQQGPTVVDGQGNTMHPIDAPAVLLPNGRVLLTASPSPPCDFPGPTSFFEYDPATNALTAVAAPSNNAGPCFTGRFLLAPNGQVLFSNQSGTVTVYTPDGAPDPAWKPVITGVPAVMAVGFHYLLSGRQFNGLSEACCYGDDATMATNYPIARLERGTGVFYCRTADHSTMAIATGTATVSTVLSIPASVPPGSYRLVVVANGIPSDPVDVEIVARRPELKVELEDGGDFGTVCGRGHLTVGVVNVGNEDLVVDKVAVVPGGGDFDVLPLPAPPMTIPPGDDVEFVVRFGPGTPGPAGPAVVRIWSNDPVQRVYDVPVTGVGGRRRLTTVIADAGGFGQVCPGEFRDLPLTLAATGSCPVTVTAVTSSSADFDVPSAVVYPLVIAPGASIGLPVRFAPGDVGGHSGVITIRSDAEDSPAEVGVQGFAPAPRLVVVAPDGADFGNVCVDGFGELKLTLNNAGGCDLAVTAITSSAPEFVPPQVDVLPLVVGAGDALDVPIRFRPVGFGAAAGVITIESNDPGGAREIAVRGFAPSGRLAVSGSTWFGEVDCGVAEKTVSVCNIGPCDLRVTGVKFARRRKHFTLINNPFPATLPPGSCLGVVVRYRAACDPECCELVITSDDPEHRKVVLDVVAYTRCEPGCERERSRGEDCRCGGRGGGNGGCGRC